MRSALILSVLFCLFFSGNLALAAQATPPPSGQVAPGQVKVDPKAKGKAKKYRPDDFGDLHDGAKKRGVDTSKPDTLKGRDPAGEIAKSVRL